VICFELLAPGKYLPADYWRKQVPRCNRLEVELGPGDGRFLIESGRAAERTLFVGFEIRAGSVSRMLESNDFPANVKIFHFDASFIVRHLLADNSVDAFHIYFPDPWWKKRHHKRRLVTPEMAVALKRCLTGSGKIYVITDVQPLFAEIRDCLEEAGFEMSDWKRDPGSPAQSSYERKYRRQGRVLEQGRFTISGVR
jgi:tRNA (guanine-N7-)-methyltransferase